VFKGEEFIENFTKFFTEFMLINTKLGFKDDKHSMLEFEAKIPKSFQSVIYQAKMNFPDRKIDTVDSIYKLICVHLIQFKKN
jgi:hypothetical protein